MIQQWLSGTQRDRIAAENGLSAGAVTNLVNEWSRGLGFAIADDPRELAVTMKKVGITAAQCASGFRAAMIMKRLYCHRQSLYTHATTTHSNDNNDVLTLLSSTRNYNRRT